MKMTNAAKSSKKSARILAVFLSLLMVFTIIPASALGVFADVTSATSQTELDNAVNTFTEKSVSITETNVLSGQTIPVDLKYDPTVAAYHTSVTNGTSTSFYTYALVGEYNITGVIATDILTTYGNSSDVAPVKSSSVTVSPVTAQQAPESSTSYTASVVGNAQKEGAKMTSFSSSVRNALTSVRVTANSSAGVKKVALYAQVTKSNRLYDGNSAKYSYNSITKYVKLGEVTIYPSSISMKLNVPSTTIALNQTVTMIAEFTQSNVAAGFYFATSNALGIMDVKQVASSGTTLQNVIQVTANNVPTTGNRITVTAYLKTSSGDEYVLRGSDGKLYTTKTMPVPGATISLSDNSATVSPTSTSLTNSSWYFSDNSGKKVTLYAITASQTVTFTTKLAPTAMRFTSSSYTLEAGDTISTSIAFTPSNASAGVTYISGNTAVATVSSSGRITGVAQGTTTIIATASDGSGISSYCTVTVKPATIKLTLNTQTVSVAQGESYQLKATITPTTTVNKTVYWSSSNAAVAQVDATGKITGVAPGTAAITCTYAGNSSKTATCYVTVTAEAAKITLPASSYALKVGDIQKLVPTFKGLSSTAVTYKSDNTSVLSVSSDGTMVALKAGSAMVTVTSVSNPTVSAYCIVTVSASSTVTPSGNGVIAKTTFTVSGKTWKRVNILSADVKTALTGSKSVVIDLTTTASNNYIVFSKYAMKRLALYADELTIKVNGWEYTFDAADLLKMASYNRAVGIYCKPGKVNENYKLNGTLKWIGIKPEIN